MSESFKISNLKKAFSKLPIPKNYPPETVTVLVEKLKYNFIKIKDEWHLKI